MTVNQTKIDQAKAKHYGGTRALDASEKSIFDGLDEAVVDKVQEVLEGVLKVKDASTVSFNEDLLVKLRNFRWKAKSTNERKAYEAINKNSDLAKNTIQKLEAVSDKDAAKKWAEKYFPNDKAIFGNSALKDAGDIYAAARLLDYVKWAQIETDATQKSHLKTKLLAAKSTNAYMAVNSVNTQVDGALLKVGVTGEDPSKEEAELKTRLAGVEADISKKKEELKKLKEKTAARLAKKQAKGDEKFEAQATLKKYQKALHILRGGADNGTFPDGTPLTLNAGTKVASDNAKRKWLTDADNKPASNTVSMVQAKDLDSMAMKEFNTSFYTTPRNNHWWENDIPYHRDRKWMIKKEYEAIGHQIIYYVLKSFDAGKFKALVDSEGVANATRIKELFDKLIKLEFVEESDVKERMKDPGFFSVEGRRNLNLDISGLGERISYTVSPKEASEETKASDLKENRETEKVENIDFKNFFEFMELAFPENTSVTSVTNPLLKKRSQYVPDSGEKKWSIRWNGKSEKAPDNTSKSWTKWAKEHKNDLYQIEKNYLEQKDFNWVNMVEFYHRAFPKTKVRDKWDDVLSGRDSDIWARERTKRWGKEIENILKQNNCEIDEETFLWLKAHTFQSWNLEQNAVDEWKDYIGNNYVILYGIDYELSPSVISNVLDLTPLEKKISSLQSQVNMCELEILRIDRNVNDCLDDENEKEKEIETLELEKASIEAQIATFGEKDIQKLKDQFWAIYNNPDEGTRFTIHHLKEMTGIVARIIALGGTIEPDLKTANGKVQKSIDNSSAVRARLLIWFTSADGQVARFAANSKDQAEAAKRDLEELKGFLKLDPVQELELTKITEKLANWDKKDGPDKGKLTELFAFDVDENLKGKWGIVDDQTLTEDKIKTIITDKYAPTKSEFGKLMAHLAEKGDGFKGENKDSYSDAAGDDNKKKEVWKKFIEKGPEVVIKTIVNHEFEIEKDNIKGRMDTYKSGDKPLKKSEYGGEGYNDDGIKQFFYEEKIGKTHKLEETKQKDPEKTPESKESSWKDWFVFRKGNVGKPLTTYIGMLILVVGVVAAIFWKNIADWWNGPAEEEGEIGEDDDDEEETKNE